MCRLKTPTKMMINRNFYASTSKRKVEVVLSSCNILVSTTSPSPGHAKMVSTKSAPGVYNDTSQSKNLASKLEYFLVRFCIPHVFTFTSAQKGPRATFSIHFNERDCLYHQLVILEDPCSAFILRNWGIIIFFLPEQ